MSARFRSWFVFLGIAISVPSYAQPSSKLHSYDLFFHWGYNRSRYLPTSLSIDGGEAYQFELQDVQAHDDPEPFSADAYINPGNFTIPQFNFRAGVIIDQRWHISGGWDHLKYVVSDGQRVRINGYINRGDNFTQNQYAGTYNGEEIDLSNRLLRMEHTDGLNYIHANIDYAFPLWHPKRLPLKVDALAGFGTGPVCPWTDTRLFGNFYRNPSIHFAGWGISVNATTRLTYGRFFIENMYRVGHIGLWDIMIIRDKVSAETKINYFEHNISVGYILPLKRVSNATKQSLEP